MKLVIRRRSRRMLKDTFQDIGLHRGLDKCVTVNVVRGKIVDRRKPQKRRTTKKLKTRQKPQIQISWKI